MSKNIKEIPYTELVERCAETSRSGSENDRPRVRGVVNDVATKEIGGKFDWSFMEASSSITCIKKYSTGTVSGTTGGAQLTFANAAVIVADMTGRKIKISGNDVVYDFTYTDSTGGTVDPPVAGTKNITSQSFNIFKPVYALASDFDRFPVKGGLILWQGGKKTILPEKRHIQYYDEYSASPGTPSCCKLVQNDTAGNPQVELVPPPEFGIALNYDYFKAAKPMRETSMGTISITASATLVEGTGTRFLEANTGDWIRVNANGTKDDSEWHRITAITHNSSLTIATAFANSSVVSVEYVICSAPDMPSFLHLGIFHGTVRNLLGNQDDPMYAYHHQQFATILTDAKVRYVTRMDSVDMEGDFEAWDYRR